MNLITLITYQFSLLPFACLACLCASLCSRTLVCTPYPTRCVDLSTYVILSFAIFCPNSHQSFFVFLLFTKVFFSISPPPCLVSHFSLFTLLFTLPDFLQQLASPACLHFVSLCGLCIFAAVRVSRTEGRVCGVAHHSCGPSAPYPNAESKHVSSLLLPCSDSPR